MSGITCLDSTWTAASASDCTLLVLLQDHPFRNVCDLRRDALTSLIQLEYTTHTAEESLSNDKVPSGLPYASIDAHMQRLDVVFLSRFLFEILRYIELLLAMQPAPLEANNGSQQAQDETSPQEEQASKVRLFKKDRSRLQTSSFPDTVLTLLIYLFHRDM